MKQAVAPFFTSASCPDLDAGGAVGMGLAEAAEALHELLDFYAYRLRAEGEAEWAGCAIERYKKALDTVLGRIAPRDTGGTRPYSSDSRDRIGAEINV